jgi:hypothetical protein
VSVQDCSLESSSIDLLEVDIGDRPRTLALFFLGRVAFQIFLLAELDLGEKKVRGEKKS